MGLIEDITGWTRKNGAPFTVLLVASFVVSSLILWLTHFKGVDQILLVSSPLSPLWTFVTYPWAYMPLADGLSLMFFVFLMFWLLQVGASVEREMGTLRFMCFWFGATALAGVVMVVGATLFHTKVGVMAPYLPESAVTILWCVRNKQTSVMMFGFLPLSGFWLGWATVVSDLLLYGAGAPVLGVLACVHLGVAYLIAADKVPFFPYAGSDSGFRTGKRIRPNQKEATTRGQVQYDQTYFDEVKRRETERSEQERLKKLFGDDT
jgi:hypothetical protein